MRLLVTGSRNWANRKAVGRALYEAWTEAGSPTDAVLVHGAARGLDSIAADIWSSKGLKVEAHSAKWDEFGKRAGILRNIEMVEQGADVCLAFPIGASVGTRHCMRTAAAAGIRVVDKGDV